jgi:SMC interacting uncharacterized protein involved in chromosome segregation
MDENDVKVRERLTAVESSVKSLHKRVDKQEDLIDNIRSMVIEMKNMREDINRIDGKVTEIENKPRKWWDAVISAIIGAVAGGIGTFILTKFIGG